MVSSRRYARFAVSALVILWALTDERSPLTWRPAVALGVISYGVYLWHLPVTRDAWLIPLAEPWRTAVVVALSVGLAALSWTLLERPLLRLRQRRPRARRDPRPERSVLPVGATSRGRSR